MKTIYWIDGPWRGRLAVVARPRGGDWLESDVRQWHRDGLGCIVSLLTADESHELGLEREAAVSTKQNVQFFAFPVTDRSVPASQHAVQTLVEKLVDNLSKGQNVGIHCRQGVGRSALLAASILVWSGVDPDRAFRQIAQARGCPVPDTSEQRHWVEKFAQSTAVPVVA